MLRQILEAIDQFAPDAVLFGLDDRTTSIRETAYPAYKAGRAEKDPALVDQLERAADLLDALGMLTVTPAGLEADDVNASAATWAEREGWNCVLITSDRDAFAHISDRTQVLRLITGGISGSPLLNPARLRAMYDVAAEHYLEYAALRGDASDNLPGVPGIGEKIAPVMLSQMGSMKAVWADIDHCAGATLVATLDSYCEEVGRSRMGATRAEAARHPGGPGALRVQPVDDVRPHRPRPRPDPRRAGQSRAAPARARTGSPAWSATSGSRRPRTWRCGSSPSRRRSVGAARAEPRRRAPASTPSVAHLVALVEPERPGSIASCSAYDSHVAGRADQPRRPGVDRLQATHRARYRRRDAGPAGRRSSPGPRAATRVPRFSSSAATGSRSAGGSNVSASTSTEATRSIR